MIPSLERESAALVRRFLHALLEARDTETVRSLLHDPVDWIGVGSGELGRTIRPGESEDLAGLERRTILDAELVPTALTPELCLVCGDLAIRCEAEEKVCYPQLSALCLRTEGGLRLRQVHLSPPCENSRAPARNIRNEAHLRAMLERREAELAERDRNMAALVRNLPGGIICCANSPQLDLIEYSDGFLDLFGYTREEVETLFHNEFARMLYPGDLEATWPLVNEQLRAGNTKEIEYRICRKDGSVIWVLDRGQLVEREDGTGYFYCILIDETETKTARQALQASLERYRIITDQTNDIIFEWDVDRDWMTIAGNWEKRFGYAPVAQGRPEECLGRAGQLHPEDAEAFRQLLRKIRGNEPYGEAELRLADSGGSYLWCRVRITLQHLEGERRRAVGVIVDIDLTKRQTQKLRRLAELDTLTGIYNKGTARELITQALEHAGPGELYALLILDVDNFKQVNDRYGHLGGDAVLTDIAGALKSLFRSEDVIGRIGGDEFCVFLSRVRDRTVLERKAKDILTLFHRLLSREEREGLSCSVGVAVSPMDGEDYLTLFQNADAALYYAKEKGKNQFAFYRQGMEWQERLGMMERARRDRTEKIESENGDGFQSGDLANYVFRVLYEADDVARAVEVLMEILGRQMGVSRSYIFEVEEDGRHIRNTFEWCAEGVSREKDNLQHVDMETIRAAMDTLEREGILYCRDIEGVPGGEPVRDMLLPQGIRAMLQCAIRRSGKLWGLVGFDECLGERSWTKLQMDTLSLVTEILGTFLIRYRAQERAEKLVRDLASILDHQIAWIYVVAAETYEILYANKLTRTLLPHMPQGAKCYRAFFGRETPCEICPLKRVGEDGSGCSQVYSAVLGEMVEAKVSTLVWQGERTAYLVSCLPAEEQEERA